jgi:16S rRNA (guanine(966)-N(2))-methyltransferase RsmD
MRIISGKYRGRQIPVPKNLMVRPTTDFAKEGLFNILSNHFDFGKVKVLDVFAGTGNISFEFISRGANSVLALDNNTKSTEFIRQTAEKFGYTNLLVIRSDYLSFLSSTIKKWDLIFADPPYNMESISEIPTLVLDRQLLNPGGILVIEHDKKINFSSHQFFSDHRVYGKVNFTFFRYG